MKRPSNSLFFVVIFTALFFSNCSKNELDFNKYKEINPEVLTPLANAKIVAGRVLKDSLITYDPDGLIHIKFNQDSVFKMTADSILKNIKLGNSTVKYSIGEIALTGINMSSIVQLSTLVAGADANTQAAFNAKNGTTDIFPAVTSSSTTPNSLPKSSQYDSLFISKGYLVFKITNHFPTTINEVQIQIWDNIPTKHSLGTAVIKNIAPGASGADSIDLTGKSLSNDLAYTLPVAKLAQSAAAVLINKNDSISVSTYGSGLKSIRGRAILPSQTTNAQFMAFDLSDPSTDARVKNILFGNAKLKVTTTSTLGTDVSLNVTFPDATKSGLAYGTIVLTAPKNSSSNSTIDFTGVNMGLGNDLVKPYNMLRLGANAQISASGTMVNFDSSNSINISIDASTAEFDYLDGYLGTKTYNFNIKDLTIGDMAKYLKGIRMENPIMRVMVDNSFGAPILVQLNIQANDGKGNTLPMNVKDMNFPYPTIAQKGQVKSQTFPIDKTNSDIVNCLGMPAQSFTIVGKAVLNPNGFVGYTDHVVKTSKLTVGFEADIPMTLTAKNFALTDTTDGKSLTGMTAFDFLELKIKTTNGFPLGGSLDLIFTDANYNKIDSITNVALLVAGAPDPTTGKVVNPTPNMATYLLTHDMLTKLDAQKCTYMILRSNFSSWNNGNTPVSIYNSSSLDISIAFRGKVKSKI